jgi:ribosome biogenesis protein MAK21
MISHVSSFNTSIQALTLVFHVQSTRELISDRFYRALYDTLFDKRLYEASKQSMYLNLLYKALKEDPSVSRTRSFVKRLVQTITHTQVPFLCGSLFLISELFKQKPGLWAMVSEPEEDDEDEVFQDVDSEDNSEEKIERKDKVKTKVTGYDARKRDPLYANADRVCLWELVPLANHFHPTVALYAKSLLSGSPIPVPKDATNYDPLLNHTLTRFLDRFVYKAPKKVKTVHHGSSIMQPSAIGSSTQLLSGGRKKTNALYEDEEEGQVVALDDAPVNQQTWSSVEDVPADEVFLINDRCSFSSTLKRGNQRWRK